LDDTDKNFGPDLPLGPRKICKFGQLILRKILKIIATSCHILRLKCTKFDFRWVLPQIMLRELTVLPDPLAGFGVLLLKGRGKRRGEGKRKKKNGRGGISYRHKL